MNLKKMVCGALSFTMLVTSGVTTYADWSKGYQFDFYGTNDEKGTFSLFIESDSEILKRTLEKEALSFELNPEENAENLIKYKFSLPADSTISFALDGYGEKDNSFVIFDKGGRLIGYTSILKAVDQDGNEIISDISISNNIIQQRFDKNINLDNISVDFEVYALQTTVDRANSFNDNFSKSEWISRAEGVSLSLYPIYAFPTNSAMYAAWDTVVSKHSGDSHWSNENGMKDQFHCYNDFASAKRPWNLEPWRPDVGYASTIAAGCNPK